MTRTLLPLLAPLLLSTSATAQTAYIDVMITDTVIAPPALIRYSCTVDANQEWMAEPNAWMVEAGKSSKAQRKMQEDMMRMQDSACKDQSDLLSRLRDQGFRIETESDDPYTVEVNKVDECLRSTVVLLSDEAELQRLVGYIKGLGNVNGSILKWEAGKAPDDPAALQRMYSRAKNEATRLAALDGQKIGRMLTADGVGAGEGGLMTYYMLMLAEMEDGNNARNRGRSVRTMRFRFELVP